MKRIKLTKKSKKQLRFRVSQLKALLKQKDRIIMDKNRQILNMRLRLKKLRDGLDHFLKYPYSISKTKVNNIPGNPRTRK